MKMSQLKFFKTVCKHMSFTQASIELHVSQPAISLAIRELETEFNIKLFDRQFNQIFLTDEGKWLLDNAESLISDFDNLEEMLHKLSKTNKAINIGVAPMIGTAYFFNSLNKYKEAFPQKEIEITEGGSLILRESVMESKIDIAVVLLNGLPKDKINLTKLFNCELVFCVDKTHPLSNKKNITFNEIDNEKIVLFKEDSYQNALIKEKFKEANSNLDVILYTSQLSSIKKMLNYGNCGAFLFKKVVEDDKNFVSISFKEPIILDIGLVWPKKKNINKELENFIYFIKQNSKE